ncbi:MAG: hypothetical protein IIZ02_00640, partial [Desulfovibrio sp.]|nr:hypothetical protein [Desulfovibrio sp.]
MSAFFRPARGKAGSATAMLALLASLALVHGCGGSSQPAGAVPPPAPAESTDKVAWAFEAGA